jgi:hypothetical protein
MKISRQNGLPEPPAGRAGRTTDAPRRRLRWRPRRRPGLDPPGTDADIAGIWPDLRDAAIAALPRWARQMYGYETPPLLTPGRRTEIRQSLGVLDAMFLGQPGVLEARQRITLRMRGVRRA